MRKEKTENEPAGIWNMGPKCLSIFRACDTVNIPRCIMAVRVRNPVVHIGKILARHLTSSTC